MNPSRIFAAHELAVIDPAMGTKMTVQFNLFGGTVLRLGTERHHYLLEGIDRMTDVGCFGLTELGYGNNAVEMETTATYDKGRYIKDVTHYVEGRARGGCPKRTDVLIGSVNGTDIRGGGGYKMQNICVKSFMDVSPRTPTSSW